VDVSVRGSPVNPDTQYYIFTRQNTDFTHSAQSEILLGSPVYPVSPKPCSHISFGGFCHTSAIFGYYHIYISRHLYESNICDHCIIS